MAENGKTDEKKTRTILLSGDVNKEMAKTAVEKIIELAQADPTRDITILIDTWGGYIDDMFTIHDIMKSVPCNIRTVGLGRVMSAGVLLLAAGTKGKRFVTPNCTVMEHQVHSGVYGTTEDLEIEAQYIRSLQDKWFSLLAKYTGQKKKKLDEDFKKEKYMNAKEALDYGLVDGILKEGKLFKGVKQ